ITSTTASICVPLPGDDDVDRHSSPALRCNKSVLITECRYLLIIYREVSDMCQLTPLQPLLIMGVSGTGKIVIDAQVAQALDRRFVDADDLHPAANKSKMRSGVPLTDEDRAPWLDSVAAEAARAPAPVIACSALKRSYRDLLRKSAPELVFIHLDA